MRADKIREKSKEREESIFVGCEGDVEKRGGLSVLLIPHVRSLTNITLLMKGSSD